MTTEPPPLAEWRVRRGWLAFTAAGWIAGPLAFIGLVVVVRPTIGFILLWAVAAVAGFVAFVLRPAHRVVLRRGGVLVLVAPVRRRTLAARDVLVVRRTRFDYGGQYPVVLETRSGRVTVDPHLDDLAGFVARLRSLNPHVRVRLS